VSESLVKRSLGKEWSPDRISRILCHRPGFFWLDSGATGGELGRYSLLGSDPVAGFAVHGGKVLPLDPGFPLGGLPDDPLRACAAAWERYPQPIDLSHPFAGGWVGYLGYEFARYLERLPATTRDDYGIPEAEWRLYDHAFVYDHHRGESWVTGVPIAGAAEVAMARARARLEEGEESVEADASIGEAAFSSNLSRREYEDRVERVREYIAAGHVYQLNLSQRLEAPFHGSVAALYRRLREVNPAPFSALVRTGFGHILSSSPERFLCWRDRWIQSRPIKGTRPRGSDRAGDEALIRELTTSEKERAELLMIVDLLRNDLGKIAVPGSVRVPALHALESYATVHHLVGEIVAEVRPGVGVLERIAATFPGGSITGAPKIRAMEIIDELERDRRDVFTGSIGYVSTHGTADFNIAIRTLVEAQGKLHFHVGSGIVWDSDPAAEYQETLDKARGILNAFPRT